MHEIQSVQIFCGVFDERAFCFDERLVSCYEKIQGLLSHV
jgi:hypothetical protein